VNKKQKLAFLILGATVVTQAGAAVLLAQQFVELQHQYKELYELAAYLAGKAEGAGVELDEADRIAMKAMKP
jgi:hypothetical protein